VLEMDPNERFEFWGHSALVCTTIWHPTQPVLLTGSADGTARIWDLTAETRGVLRSSQVSSASRSLQAMTASTAAAASAAGVPGAVGGVAGVGSGAVAAATGGVPGATTFTSAMTSAAASLLAASASAATGGSAIGGLLVVSPAEFERQRQAIVDSSVILEAAPDPNEKLAREESNKNQNDEDEDDDEDEAERKVKRVYRGGEVQRTEAKASAAKLRRNRAVVAADWSPAQDYLAVATYDGAVLVFSSSAAITSSSAPAAVLNDPSLKGLLSAQSYLNQLSLRHVLRLPGSSRAHDGPVAVCKFAPLPGSTLPISPTSGSRSFAMPNKGLEGAPGITPNSILLLTAGVDGVACIWDAEAGTLIRKYGKTAESASETKEDYPTCHAGPILDADWRSPYSFATGGADGNIFIYDIRRTSNTPIYCMLKPHAGHAHHSRILDREDELKAEAELRGSPPTPFDPYVAIPGVPAPSPTAPQQNAQLYEINTLRWSPSGSLLATGGEDGAVLVWHVPEIPPYITLPTSTEKSGDAEEEGEDGADADEAMTATPTTASGKKKKGGKAQLDAQQRSQLKELQRKEQLQKELGNALAGSTTTAHLVRPLLRLIDHRRAVTTVRFNVSARHLSLLPPCATSNEGGAAAALYAPAAQYQHPVSPYESPGVFLASSSQDCTVKIWDIAKGRCLVTLSRHIHPVNTIAWSLPNPLFNPLTAPVGATPSSALPAVAAMAAMNTSTATAASVSSNTTPATSSSAGSNSGAGGPNGGAPVSTTTTTSASLIVPASGMLPTVLPSGIATGQYLATLSHERVHIWSVADGCLVKTIHCPAGATDVAWSNFNPTLVVTSAGGSSTSSSSSSSSSSASNSTQESKNLMLAQVLNTGFVGQVAVACADGSVYVAEVRL